MTAPPPGLQPERTALAWTRTALAMLVTGTVLLRLGVSGATRSSLTVAAGVLLLLAALLAWRTGRQRVSRFAVADPAVTVAAAQQAAAVMALVTATAAVLTAATAILT